MCKKIERVILFLIVFLHVGMIQATSQIKTVHLQDCEISTEMIERMLMIETPETRRRKLEIDFDL